MNSRHYYAASLLLPILLTCAACSQPQWAFAPPSYPSPKAALNSGEPGNAADSALPYNNMAPRQPNSGVVAASATAPIEPAQPAALDRQPGPPGNQPGSQVVASPLAVPAPTGPTVWAAPGLIGGDPSQSTGVQQATGDAPAIGPPILVPLSDPDSVSGEYPYESIRPTLEQRLARNWDNIVEDHIHYYSWSTLRDFSLALGGAAALAETSMDQHFRNWYQDKVRNSSTDNFANFMMNFGNGAYMIPGAVGLAVAGQLLDEYPLADFLGEYGTRISRAYLVGAPPMLAMQYTLGSTRPEYDSPNSSHWTPFQHDTGVSGHAFMGSVPFLTAAEMTDNPFLKGTFFFASTLTPWARVNVDAHYLSQVWLGWCMGYLAVRAVNETQAEDSHFSVEPLIDSNGAGIRLIYCH